MVPPGGRGDRTISGEAIGGTAVAARAPLNLRAPLTGSKWDGRGGILLKIWAKFWGEGEIMAHKPGCKRPCWHVVGRHKNGHGPYAPMAERTGMVLRCCWCGALEGEGNDHTLTPDQVEFDPVSA